MPSLHQAHRSQMIGLVGGMSWESTAVYYRLLNQSVRARLGGLHSARLLLHSVDFAVIERLQAEERWADAGAAMLEAAQGLMRAGADFVLLCTNTMHRVADVLIDAGVPLLHIADATGAAVRARGLSRVGLLGTGVTMEQPFYRQRLQERFGLEVLVPKSAARGEINRVIFEELCVGQLLQPSRRHFAEAAAELVGRGADCIVLGCTEIGLLLPAGDVSVPLFDTTVLHVEAAIERALGTADPPSFKAT